MKDSENGKPQSENEEIEEISRWEAVFEKFWSAILDKTDFDIFCKKCAIIYIDKYMEIDMLELGISQAQSQFTKILNKLVVIVDKKSHRKKAVILPYEEYQALVKQAADKEELKKGSFSKFAGMLDDSFQTDDARYNAIVK